MVRDDVRPNGQIRLILTGTALVDIACRCSQDRG